MAETPLEMPSEDSLRPSLGRRGLIGIETRGVKSWELLADGLRLVKSLGVVEKVSDVYAQPVEEPRNQNQSSRDLCAVISLTTTFSPREIAFLVASATSWSGGAVRQIVLLCLDQMFLMTPDLTVPHPEMHSSPPWIIPSSEIEPDWVHPVLRTTLKELGQKIRGKSMLEFYAQSKALVDFSHTQN